MQINPYNNLTSSLRPDIGNPSQVDKSGLSDQADQAAALGKDFGRIIEKAMAEPDNSSVVEQAKKALAAGTLDTPQMWQSTAERLLEFGI